MTDMNTGMPFWWYGPTPWNVVSPIQQQQNFQNDVNARLMQSANNSVAATNALANQTFQQGQDNFWKWSDNATRLNAAYVASNLAIGNAQPVGTYNGNALSPFATGTAPIQHLGGTTGLQPFNPGSYLMANPDVFKAGADPWQHYNQFGQNEGRQGAWDATTTFNTSNYLANNPDVFTAGADPMQHWLLHGYDEGRQGGFGGPDFNEQNYLANNPDVFKAGMDPTAHWLQFGSQEGRQGGFGGPDFNEQNYLANNPDVFKAGADPIQHWLAYGQNEGRQGGWGENPFNAQNYSAHNPDVAAAGVDPTAHWLQFGSQEGRQGGWGNDAFNPQEYLLNNRDVAAAGADPLQHWMNHGYKEGRQQAFGGTEDADWGGYFSQAGTGSRDAIAAAYLQTNPDVFDWAKTTGQDPTKAALDHLTNFGYGEGRTGFDAAGYLAQNQDVAAAGVNPFQHWMNHGYGEGRQGAFGDNDDYWGRGYMASDDPYGFGDPTGVGGSGYGDGFGGYGSAEDNPWGLPPGANVADPRSFFVYSDPGVNPWQDTRQAFYNELTNNPDRMYEMAVRGYLELKRDPTGRQGVFEAMFNQKAARPELDPLRHKYFPHDVEKDPAAPAYLRELANTRATLMNQPELLAKLYGEIGRAYSSNITHGATDWASGKVADRSGNRTTETYKSPVEGERYFIKNIPNLYDGLRAGEMNRDWLLGIQQQLPDYHWPGS